MRQIQLNRDMYILIIKLCSGLSPSCEFGITTPDYIYDIGRKLGTIGLDYLAIRDEELNENQ